MKGSSFEVQALGGPAGDMEKASMPAKESPTSLPPRSLVFQHEARELAGWLDVDAKTTGPVRVRLEPWGTVFGQVVDDERKPSPDLTFEVDTNKPRLGGGAIDHRPARVRSDADGRFCIEGLAPGLKYHLSPQTPPGRSPRRIEIAPVAPGETRDLGTITIKFRDSKE